MLKFFRQFSFPGGIGSHCTPETPGSIHEGGELGYSLSHALWGGFRQSRPDRHRRGRRRRGGNWTAGDLLAFQQISEPDSRRRGAAGPASERLQDRESRPSSRVFRAKNWRHCFSGTATSRILSKATIPTDAPEDGGGVWSTAYTRFAQSSSMRDDRRRRPARAGR